MELLELENIWKECNQKIADNNRINREILRRMLLHKPEKTINWMKVRAGLHLLSPLVPLIWLAVTDYQIHITSAFYIGLGLFISTCVIVYVWDLRYFLKVRALNLSDATLTIKKNIAALEKYKVKATLFQYMLMPVGVAGIVLMFFRTFGLNTDLVIMIFLMLTVCLASAYYRFKYSIGKRFRTLNKEIEEIERMENE